MFDVLPVEIWLIITDYLKFDKYNLYLTNKDFLSISLMSQICDYELVIATIKTTNIPALKLLIDYYNSESILDYALYFSCGIGNVRIIREMIPDNYLGTEKLIFSAVQNDQDSVINFFVSRGFDLRKNNDYLLRLAAEKNSLKVAKYLVSKGANCQAYNNASIQKASIGGHFEMVKFLVENGASVASKKCYAIKQAKLYGHNKIVEYLEAKLIEIVGETTFLTYFKPKYS
ncbi:ankyrin repeat protein [Niemeyer virus]|uniref:Ankyrin repeat-containing protein n=1 Tax=Acanthamoeba polyphaga mimivirus Kroon TaxID=3069720 RepID=A0A0G2Y9S8_9VIRU|nr:ankyrin repeat-containing protein [Acanthamoeba polyphaga mimivirus]AKI79881.1 ankyrin repeat-containing protein [Acanthamoeba polyphaga mimivirus Kroon]ALR83726.1 ankyrin repeat protein [Niemeyer virus]